MTGDNSKYFSIDSGGNVTINSNNSSSIPGDGVDATVTVTLTYNGNSLDNNTAKDIVYIDILYCSVIIIARLSNNKEDTAATIYYNTDNSTVYNIYTSSFNVPYGTTVYYYATTDNSGYYYTYTLSSPNTKTITNADTTLVITAATDSITSTVFNKANLSYGNSLTGTAYTNGESISPTLTYAFIDTYSSGGTETVSSGATVEWSINDTENFSIDGNGIVTALSDNYSSTKTATVTATITYNGALGTATASITQLVATDSVTSVKVSNISLTYYSDKECTTVGDTLSSTVTTLYPKVTASVIVYTSSNTNGATYNYDSTDSSCTFLSLGGAVSLKYEWNDSTTCMSIDTDGKVTYGTGILTSKQTGEVILTVDASYDEVSNSGDNEDTVNVYAQNIAGTLYVKASEYPDDGISYTLTWDSSEMTLMQIGYYYYTSGTASDTITQQATYACFMNVSNWASGYSISCAFTEPDGYSITSTNPAGNTITAGNITILSATLEE